jgi:cation transport ATPase
MSGTVRRRTSEDGQSHEVHVAVIGWSRRTRCLVLANLARTATFITAPAVWDLTGYLPLPLGVLRREGSTMLVELNGLRLCTPLAGTDLQFP